MELVYKSYFSKIHGKFQNLEWALLINPTTMVFCFLEACVNISIICSLAEIEFIQNQIV